MVKAKARQGPVATGALRVQERASVSGLGLARLGALELLVLQVRQVLRVKLQAGAQALRSALRPKAPLSLSLRCHRHKHSSRQW